jgi:hypothetical protein
MTYLEEGGFQYLYGRGSEPRVQGEKPDDELGLFLMFIQQREKLLGKL